MALGNGATAAPHFGNGPAGSGGAEGGKAAYRSGFDFAKADVMLLALQVASVELQELAVDDEPTDRSALMATVDRLNDRYWRGSIALASTSKSNDQRIWTMKQSLKTPEYSTRWADVPRVLA